MDFRLGSESDLFRAEVRQFLAKHLTADVMERTDRTGVQYDREFSEALRDKGWLGLELPVEMGGRGRDPLQVVALVEEMERSAAPYNGILVTMLVSKVIAQIGSAQMKAEILPRVFDASLIFALGMTEPDCGSDVASVRTRAAHDGDKWIVNGQKMFTTNAQIADYLLLLARTNPDVPKHRGLTVFLLPLKQDGVKIQRVETLSGERTNIVFLDDVAVPDRLRIGDVDDGWQVIRVALGNEHGHGYAGLSERLLEHAERWAGLAPNRSGSENTDVEILTCLARAATEVEVALLLQRRVAWLQAVDSDDHAKGSMAKLFSTERLERQAADFLELLGPDGIRAKGDPSAPVAGEIEYSLRHAKGTTIYAGTSQIHRNVIAQHGLRLPRPR